MKQEQPIATGSCLCGEVCYEITGHLGIFQYCHCSRCRKFTGSAFAANLLVSPKQFRWLKGEDQVGRYELAEAKHFATGFCKRCGSSLPWQSQSGKAVIVPAGTLDKDPGIRPSQNIFTSSAADWFEEPHKLPHYDALPSKK
ncbi:MAG: GFA family protein [Candidatus Thiodiazotropha sp. 6PLUC9]